MKRTTICLILLFVLATAAFAETKAPQGQETLKKEGQQMQMMCPKMRQMQGMMQGEDQMPPVTGQMMCRGMMMQNMMQMMSDMLDTQEKIVAGVKKSDEKRLLQTIKDMKSRMQGMMSACACKCMMGNPLGEGAPSTSEGMTGTVGEKPGPHVH